MDFLGLVLFGVIGGLMGWAVSRYFGFNPWAIVTVVSVVAILLPFFGYYFSAMNDPKNATDYIQPMLKHLGDSIPGVIAGDLSAVIVGRITGRS